MGIAGIMEFRCPHTVSRLILSWFCNIGACMPPLFRRENCEAFIRKRINSCITIMCSYCFNSMIKYIINTVDIVVRRLTIQCLKKDFDAMFFNFIICCFSPPSPKQLRYLIGIRWIVDICRIYYHLR